MKFGICSGIANEHVVKTVRESGFDYIEGSFQFLVNGSDEEKALAPKLLKEFDLPCTVVNCFLPGDLKPHGPTKDNAKLYDYVKRGLEYGKPLGLEKVIFGSGGAKHVDEGEDYYTAFNETADFLHEIVSPLFGEYGVILAIEPLRPEECNIINTVREGATLAAAAKADNIYVLADIYHMVESGDKWENMLELAGKLRHAHISDPRRDGPHNRVYMKKADEFDYLGFISTLKKVGCDTCSVEAALRDVDKDVPAAIRVLRAVDKMTELL